MHLMKKALAALCLTALVGAAAAIPTAAADEAPVTVAHWRFQNETGYVSGSVDDDKITVHDLTGNGNDLVTATVGNGDQLDIFTWDDGCEIPTAKGNTALKFGNTKKQAATVDPYSESETSYTGGYTSGKYLETVENAPMNAMLFENGFSFEIVYKLSSELDNNYNRYTGLFSRQGVVEGANEPPFSIALAEWNNDENGTLGVNGTWMQYVHVDPDGMKTNNEYGNAMMYGGDWHHILVTSDGDITEIYIDGEYVDMVGESSAINVTDPTFSWEVGVGRKDGAGHEGDSKNENVPEGMIRRLFAGSISEIRVTDGYMNSEDSLFFKAADTNYDTGNPAGGASAGAAPSSSDLFKDAEFYLTFEDGVKDDMGKHTFAADGDVPTVDGRFGKAIATDSEDHFVYSEDVEFGTDSWTLTSWVKIDEHSGDQVLFGNKDWNSGGNPGWLITPRDGDWKINGNPGSRFDFQYSYKDSVLKSEKGDWHHIAVVVDRESGMLSFYVNGVQVLESYSISEYGEGDLDGLIFTLGQDGTGFYSDGSLKANFDEVALFKRALTADEVAAIYTYAPEGYEPAVIVTKEEAGGGKSDAPAPAIGAENGYVTDGLQIFYDGANNTGVGQDKNSATWRDVSGNGYDFEVSLSGNNHWTDKSYYIDSTANYFPEKVMEIANGDQYTIELALGEIEQPGTNWVSLIISDNDEFSLFVRVENDNLEYKYNDNNRLYV